MPLPWPAIFKAIPWSEVVAAAPKVLDQAKRLAAAARRTDTASSGEVKSSASAQGPVNPVIEARLSGVEKRVEEMGREAVSSAELLKSLAEQNAQLVQALQIVSSKIRRLTVVVVAFSCVVGALLIWRLLS